jgi:GPH family glycoside/pentoside/hexuronide:cation symporter
MPVPPERMPTTRRVLYALGSTGYQISDRIVIAIAVYFYLPPPGRGLAPQVPEGLFLGALTAFGVAMLAGRAFDAFSDPLVGFLSDRSRARLGRRRVFLLAGWLPTALLPALLFFPPAAAGDVANVFWLAALLSLYFVAFTVYAAPHLALFPEIATTKDERARLSTLTAVVSFPVVGLYGAAWPLAFDAGRALGLEPATALRAFVLLSCGLAFVLCALPILAVDERRFCAAESSGFTLRQALAETLRDRAFLIYLGAQMLFVVGINLFAASPAYYATVVLGRSEGFAGLLGLPLFGVTLACFPLLLRAVHKFGPKRVMLACDAVVVVGLAAFGALVPEAPGGPHDARNLAIVWSAIATIGVAVAGFLVLPWLMISQVIDADAARTRASRAAIYFGVQGLGTKGMYGIASAILAYLFSRFGKSPDEPFGVLVVGPIAAAFIAASALVLWFYPEERVTRLGAPADTLRAP